MLLHESRRAARTLAKGEIILLDDQDRSLWNRARSRRERARSAAAVFASVSGPTPCRQRSRPSTPTRRRRNRLGADRRALRFPVARRAVAGSRAEPCRGRGDARRAPGGTGSNRRTLRAWRFVGLPPRPCRSRRSVPAAGRPGRCPGLLRTSLWPSRGRSRNGGSWKNGSANSRHSWLPYPSTSDEWGARCRVGL